MRPSTRTSVFPEDTVRLGEDQGTDEPGLPLVRREASHLFDDPLVLFGLGHRAVTPAGAVDAREAAQGLHDEARVVGQGRAVEERRIVQSLVTGVFQEGRPLLFRFGDVQVQAGPDLDGQAGRFQKALDFLDFMGIPGRQSDDGVWHGHRRVTSDG